MGDMSALRRRRVALLVIVTVALTGCSAAGSDLEERGALTATPAPARSPLATYPPPRVGMDAALEGIVRLAGECVVLEGADGSNTVPVFPAGEASWEAGVLVWDGEEYRMGDVLLAGGGAGPSQQADAYLPRDCQGLPSFLVGS